MLRTVGITRAFDAAGLRRLRGIAQLGKGGISQRFVAAQTVSRSFSTSPYPSQKPVTFRYKMRKKKNEAELADEEEKRKLEMAKNAKSKIRQWGIWMGTQDFNNKATKYYVAMYIAFLFYGYYYFGKMYRAEEERKDLLDKRDSGAELSEWEKLRIRELSGDHIRTIDKEKLKAYHELRDEYDAKLKKCDSDEEKAALGEFNPQPADIDGKYDVSAETAVLPARDLSKFYDGLAPEYDKEINAEERWTGMKSKRKWAMRQAKGDVLEVASGTGRNINYIDPATVHSYTFIDPSEKMMEECYDKFKKKWPKFPRVKFVVGRAEDLVKLSEESEGKAGAAAAAPPLYDTIIETFGLCSEEDPVQSLKNMGALLKPGGRIILLEHGRGSNKYINRKLDKDAQRHSDKWGCRWNLDIGDLVDESGLDMTVEKRSHMGTTWQIVAKRPEDPLDYEELNFMEKYFTSNRTKNFDSSKGPNNAFGEANDAKDSEDAKDVTDATTATTAPSASATS